MSTTLNERRLEELAAKEFDSVDRVDVRPTPNDRNIDYDISIYGRFANVGEIRNYIKYTEYEVVDEVMVDEPQDEPHFLLCVTEPEV